jgi:hypothetical protein
MGIWKFLFTSTTPPEPPTYEIVENHLSIDDQPYQVCIRKGGREFYVEDHFKTASGPEDLTFNRFFLLNEKPPKPHFAPSLQQALDWFTGRKQPKDGYNSICWGDRFTYTCAVCKATRVVPLRITRVERLTVASAFPKDRGIIGFRVVEVESELTGKGIPIKKIDDRQTLPVLKWHQFPNRYLCGGCARQLAEVGREAEAANAFVFEVK